MTDQERDKRLIETALPLEKVSDESQSEKYRSYGRLSNLHRWWAVRPLSASRVAAYASLVSEPEDDEKLEEEMNFISELCEWENMHNPRSIERASERISEEFEEERPRVLDPFGGAGTMPLEAKRIGLESHSVEYNPVAYLIELGVLSYPEVGGASGNQNLGESEISLTGDDSKLIKDLRSYADQVSNEVEKKLDDLYDSDEVSFIWARTLPCQSPGCDLDIPLIKSFWLADRDNSEKKIYNIECSTDGKIDSQIYRGSDFEIIRDGNKRKIEIKESGKEIDPTDGTVQRGSVSCPACGNSFKAEKSRELANNKGFGHRLMVVVETGDDGKEYRLPTDSDRDHISNAREELEEIEDKWIPDEEIPVHENSSRYLTPSTYGIESWGDLFNPRQRITMSTFAKKLSSLYDEIAEEEDEEYAKAVTTYLGLALDKMAQYNCTLASWQKGGEKANPVYRRSALSMAWDYVETNHFCDGYSGSWGAAMDLLPRAIKTASGTLGESEVNLGDATNLSYPDNHFDAVLTDPPYYDNVPYAALSDFFYVWLKRSTGDLYPEAFSTPLTPKSSEIIQDKSKHSPEKDPEEFFEKMLSQAFSEMSRVLKDDGVTTIVFAHKSSEAWAQMIRSLLESGLVVTATWPIHTEKRNRVRSMGSASLASSIYFVCRNRRGSEVGYYSDVEEELRKRVHKQLDYFWDQGIRGADLLISAIGPATEVFGQYETVKRLSGEEITVDELLEDTQRLVSDYALGKVLEGDVELGSIDPETRFYILYRWAFANQKEDYDEVRKLAQVNEADTERLERLGILDVSRGDAVMNPPQNRDINDPAEVLEGNNLPLVGKIQRAAILWESGQRDKLKTFIEEHGMDEEFWRSAQAISETLPEEEKKSKKEKQMLHGLLGYGGQTEFEPSGQSKLGKYTDGGEDQ